MKKTVLITDLALMFSALAAWVFLAVSEGIAKHALRGQTPPAWSRIVFDYSGLIVIIALGMILVTWVQIGRGRFTEIDATRHIAETVLFVSVTLWVALIASILPHVLLSS